MSTKKAVNLSLDPSLLARARAEGMNLSAMLEKSVQETITSLDAVRWRQENVAGLAAMAKRISDEGVAGDEYRSFG